MIDNTVSLTTDIADSQRGKAKLGGSFLHQMDGSKIAMAHVTSIEDQRSGSVSRLRKQSLVAGCKSGVVAEMGIEVTGECAVWLSFCVSSAADVVHFVLAKPCEGDAGLVIATVELARDRAEAELT